jgi:phosphoglycolate phosphatase-like HAD superfamily hydrolase
MPKLLALDFDGVISDSAPESYVVALRTWCEFVPGTRLTDQTDVLVSSHTPTARQVLSESLYGDFLERMPLGSRAEDYAVVLASLDRGVDVPDQSAYDSFKTTLDADWLSHFHQRFYETRRALCDADVGGWHALMGPYPKLREILRAHASEVELAIATAKDARSVRALLHAYGIEDLFSGERLLDKETGVNKVAHLECLQVRFGFAYSEMVFVDDKVNHLDHVATLGVECALAGWGYNGPREHALARERGHRVLELDDFEAQLFGMDG